jgi:hypothetical protein
MARPRTPTEDQLRRLRTLRLQAGLSLDTVAERTGLPVAHVEALEDARIDELPAGPYIRAYYRLVKGVVGGPDDADEVPLAAPPPEPWPPLWVVRGIALLAVCGLLGVAGWQVWAHGLDDAVDVAGDMVAGTPDPGPDQRLSLEVRREAPFRVVVDGEVVLDGRLPPGRTLSFQARDRIEVDVTGAEDALIQYNGQRIVPQGRQGVPRKLVFIDDLSPDG